MVPKLIFALPCQQTADSAGGCRRVDARFTLAIRPWKQAALKWANLLSFKCTAQDLEHDCYRPTEQQHPIHRGHRPE
jgi:hypothetical protein